MAFITFMLTPFTISFLWADKTGELSFINRVSCSIIPAQIAVSPDGKHLALATYMGMTYEIFPIAEDGRLQEASSVLKQSGSGPHARQKISHPILLLCLIKYIVDRQFLNLVFCLSLPLNEV